MTSFHLNSFAHQRASPYHVEPLNFLRNPVNLSQEHELSFGQNLTFFLQEIDDTNSETSNWEAERRIAGDSNLKANYWQYFVRMWGVTQDQKSVSVYVADFHPYLYVEAPPSWSVADMQLCLQRIANDPFVTVSRGKRFSPRCVSKIEQTWRTNSFGFTNYEQITMFKISFFNVAGRRNLIRMIQENRTLHNYQNLGHKFWMWDVCVSPLEQFKNEYKIRPGRWVTVAANQYVVREAPMNRRGKIVRWDERRTRQQIDIDCTKFAVTCDFEREEVAPLLIESFDIEVANEPDIFPVPNKAAYPVIQIGVTVQRYGDPYGEYLFQCCFCLKSTVNWNADKVKLYCFETEREVLLAYYYFWTDCLNADVRVAYNQFGFDEEYLYNRSRQLLTEKIPREIRESTDKYQGILEYGRPLGELNYLEKNYSSSGAHGGATKTTVKQVGRTQIDLMVFAREQWKLIMASLNDVSEAILGASEQKDNVHHTEITPLFHSGPAGRAKVAKYCVRDTELPLMLLDKKCVIIEYIETARLTGVTMHYLVNRKQTLRTETMMYYKMHHSEERYSVPEDRVRFVEDPHVRDLVLGLHKQEGALVLQCTPNFYPQPICTLDFAGLYPSIMRGYGLCVTRLILNKKYLKTTKYRTDVVRNKEPGAQPYTFHWAIDQDKKSMTYQILTSVLDARARAKKQRSEWADKIEELEAKGLPINDAKFMYDVYDKRQLALKVIANSQYGYTIVNYHQCKMSCPPIGITVTHYGRYLIGETRKAVHAKVPGSRCVYGDTDSVMIKFSEEADEGAFKKAFELGKWLASEITKLFPPEVILEFEKVYYPYLQIGQKRYAGMKYEKLDEKGKLKCAGLKSVKSDTFGFLSDLEYAIVHHMVEMRDPIAAKKHLIDSLTRFVNEPIATDKVVISKKMSKELTMYNQSNQIATIARAMTARSPGNGPRAGDKIHYVHCLDENKNPVDIDVEHFDKNRDQFEINKLHYVSNLMKLNLGRLFDLPALAQDPYHWFEPFEKALRQKQSKVKPITSYFVQKKNPAPAATSKRKPSIHLCNDGKYEFADRLFSDSAYNMQSDTKRKVLKQRQDKADKDYCRANEISAAELKNQRKRKQFAGFSQFLVAKKRIKK